MTKLTVREQALRNLKQLFVAMEAGQPVTDPYTITWSLVERFDVGDRARGKNFVMQIFDLRETKIPRIGQMEPTLRVFLEWKALCPAECDPSEFANDVLGQIQRRIREDITLTDTVINVIETGNEITIDDFADRHIEGNVSINILYKHAENDPREYLTGSI